MKSYTISLMYDAEDMMILQIYDFSRICIEGILGSCCSSTTTPLPLIVEDAASCRETSTCEKVDMKCWSGQRVCRFEHAPVASGVAHTVGIEALRSYSV